MRKFLIFVMLITASFLIACSPAANSNTANKPANAANNSAAKPAADTAAIETEIKKLASDAAAAMSKNDAAAFEKGTTDNYMFVNPTGVVSTRAERAGALRSGDSKYESVAYDEMSVRVNAEGNGAVVIAPATVKGINMGNKVDGQYRVTQVWSKTPDGWKQASGQATPIAASSSTAPASNAAAANSNKAPAANANTNAGK